MTRITQTECFENELSPMIDGFFRTFCVASLLRANGAYKQSGIAVITIFQKLFALAFSGRSLFMSLKDSSSGIGKDTFYRFVNSCRINWFRFTTMSAAAVINGLISGATGEERVKVFIVDDTVYARGRSKKAELLSWVRDHARQTTVRGFRLLSLGWSDGNSFFPVNGCLLSSAAKRCNEGEERRVDKRSCGGRQRLRALSKAPDVMLEMLRQSKRSGIRASHVLFDSWFSSPRTIMAVTEENLDVIAMLKKTPKAYYSYNGEMLPVTEIYKRNRKRRGRSKYLLSVSVGLRHRDSCKSVPAKLVFVRNRNRKKDYLVLISTDITLSEEEVIRIYGKRWDIEVFFKVCKSYLKLTGECRSLSYDAMTAYVAIVFLRYTMLAAERRVQIDGRTFGELYYAVCDELPDITWIEAFRLLMEQIVSATSGKLFLTAEELQLLLERFLSVLPQTLRSKLRKCA